VSVQHIPSLEMPTDRSAIDTDVFTASVGRFDAPSAPPGRWHHHGKQHVVAYVICGSIRIESGPDGGVLTEPQPGDLVYIEPGTVHRESYEGEVGLVGFTFGPRAGSDRRLRSGPSHLALWICHLLDS